MKTCPICNASCYEDMHTCYSCMHNFDEDGILPHAAPVERDSGPMNGIGTCVGAQPSDASADARIAHLAALAQVNATNPHASFARDGARAGDEGEDATRRLRRLHDADQLDEEGEEDGGSGIDVAEPPMRVEIPTIDQEDFPYIVQTMPRRMSGRETLRRRGSVYPGENRAQPLAPSIFESMPPMQSAPAEGEARYQLVVKLQPVI